MDTSARIIRGGGDICLRSESSGWEVRSGKMWYGTAEEVGWDASFNMNERDRASATQGAAPGITLQVVTQGGV